MDSLPVVKLPAREVPEDSTQRVGGFSFFQMSPEPSSEERMRILEVAGLLDFWNDPAEDVYCGGTS